jgi:hypothetical protein
MKKAIAMLVTVLAVSAEAVLIAISVNEIMLEERRTSFVDVYAEPAEETTFIHIMTGGSYNGHDLVLLEGLQLPA